MPNTQAYQNRLSVPLEGATIPLFTKTGLQVCSQYERIVIGERGAYVEIKRENLTQYRYIPHDQEWRTESIRPYYHEYRTSDAANIKIYHQQKRVDYADYRLAMFYISPFDLYTADGKVLIEKKNTSKNTLVSLMMLGMMHREQKNE